MPEVFGDDTTARYRGDPERRRQQRCAWIKRTYGLTCDEYQSLLEQQGGVCAVCGRPETGIDPRLGNRRLMAVDHDHKTGRIRGLLCRSCNMGLGHFGDDPELLARAQEYLRA